MYTIKVLSSQDFDNLPYKRSKESLGVADPDTNTAYVRFTVFPELNRYLIDHEFEHLIETVPTDEEDGVRYAGKGIISSLFGGAKNIARAGVTGVGSAVKGLGNMVSGGINRTSTPMAGGIRPGQIGYGQLQPRQLAVQNAINSGMGGALAGPMGAMGSIFSQKPSSLANSLGSFASSFLQSPQTQQTQLQRPYSQQAQMAQAAPPAPDLSQQSNAGQQAGPGYLGAIDNSGIGFGPTAGGGGPSSLEKLTKGFGAGFAQSAGNYAGEGIANTLGKTAGGILGQFANPAAATGAGLFAAGLGTKMPQVPELPESIKNFQSIAMGGGPAIGQLASQKLTDLMNQKFEPMNEPEIQAALHQLNTQQIEELRQKRAVYHSARPGTDYITDSDYQREIALMNDRYNRARTDEIASRTRELKGIFDQQRLSQIQQATGIGQQELSQRLAAAGYDLDRMLQQLQIDLSQAEFKQGALTGLGSNLATIGPLASLINSMRQ